MLPTIEVFEDGIKSMVLKSMSIFAQLTAYNVVVMYGNNFSYSIRNPISVGAYYIPDAQPGKILAFFYGKLDRIYTAHIILS